MKFQKVQLPLLADMHTDGVRFDREVLAAYKAGLTEASETNSKQSPD